MNTVETKPASAILLLRVVSKRPVLHLQLHKFGKIIVKCNIMIQLKQKRNFIFAREDANFNNMAVETVVIVTS